MPGGDGTGPMGLGPMTGRAAGYCAGYSTPGYMNPVGRGGYFGWGRGFVGGYARGGRGRRNWFYATGMPGWMRQAQGMPARAGQPAYPATVAYPTQKQEADMLRQQVQAMQAEIDTVQQRIKELESSGQQ